MKSTPKLHNLLRTQRWTCKPSASLMQKLLLQSSCQKARLSVFLWEGTWARGQCYHCHLRNLWCRIHTFLIKFLACHVQIPNHQVTATAHFHLQPFWCSHMRRKASVVVCGKPVPAFGRESRLAKAQPHILTSPNLPRRVNWWLCPCLAHRLYHPPQNTWADSSDSSLPSKTSWRRKYWESKYEGRPFPS